MAAAKKRAHVRPNAFRGEGANGGCFFEISQGEKPQTAHLYVGCSCVVVHRAEIPVTWLSELIAIATSHKDGIAGFLAANLIGGEESYALMCDPAAQKEPTP